MTPSDVGTLQTALARFNAFIFAVVFGLVAGAGLWVATLFLVVKGGNNPGAMLNLLGEYLPGYTVSFGGAFLGFLWALVLGAALSFVPAWIFYRGVIRAVVQSGVTGSDDALLERTARLHVPSFAMALGLFCGGLLFLATLWLALQDTGGHPVGPHLVLLSNYFPGYSVSVGGAFLGLLYMFLTGSVAFAAVAILYNRLVGPGRAARAGAQGGVEVRR